MALKFNRLTRDAARKLKPGERLTEHGIIAECLKNGDVRYSVNIMCDGHRVHRVIGRDSEGVTRQQAEEAIEQFRTDARADRLDLPTGRKRHRTLAESWEDYLTRLEETDGRDLVNKRRHLKLHLVPQLGGERLDKITNFRLLHYRTRRKAEGASIAEINRELSTLSHMLHKAASSDWGWIKPEKVPAVPREEEPPKPIKVLPQDHQQSLLKASIADQDPRAWLFVMFGLNAAMRHGEIVKRRYDQIDWENCRIIIDRAKAGPREQPITPALRDALQRQRDMEADPKGWIFPAARRNCKTPHRPDMREPFARIVKRAGLDPRECTPHVMRHTALTALAKKGVDVLTIKRISGHKTTKTVERYIHIHGNHIDEAISFIELGPAAPITRELHTAEISEPQQSDGVVALTPKKSAA